MCLLLRLTKGHEKANKGNSAEPFVYGRYVTLRARVGESEKSMVDAKCECVCVCVLANYLD